MKTKIGFLFAVTFPFALNGQPCDGYFPSTIGTVIQMTTYNDKDKVQTVSSLTIQDVEQKSDEVLYKIHSEIVDDKEKPMGKSDYEAHCEKGSFFISMKSMITAEQLKAWQDMDVAIEADDLDYPNEFFPGQKLNDAHIKVTVSMNSMPMPGFSVDITDRVIEGTDTITTPAGTFTCIKIKSKQKIKNIVSYEVQTIEWLSKGNGIVKTESYKGNKRKGYSLMTTIKK